MVTLPPKFNAEPTLRCDKLVSVVVLVLDKVTPAESAELAPAPADAPALAEPDAEAEAEASPAPAEASGAFQEVQLGWKVGTSQR